MGGILLVDEASAVLKISNDPSAWNTATISVKKKTWCASEKSQFSKFCLPSLCAMLPCAAFPRLSCLPFVVNNQVLPSVLTASAEAALI